MSAIKPTILSIDRAAVARRCACKPAESTWSTASPAVCLDLTIVSAISRIEAFISSLPAATDSINDRARSALTRVRA